MASTNKRKNALTSNGAFYNATQHGIQNIRNDIDVFDRTDLTIRRGDTELAVGETLENMLIELEVLHEVIDEVLTSENYKNAMSVQDRIDAKKMLKKLSEK